MEESIKDLQQSLIINKNMLHELLSSEIDDDTLSATFYKISDENNQLLKSNQKLVKERDIALFKAEKMEFERTIVPQMPMSEDVRKSFNEKSIKQLDGMHNMFKDSLKDLLSKFVEENSVEKVVSEIESLIEPHDDLKSKVSKVFERMNNLDKQLEEDDEITNFVKQNNGQLQDNFLQKELTVSKSFFSTIQSRDSHSPVPRLNLKTLKYKDKKLDMKEYAEKLEESIKLLRQKIKRQAKDFDNLRLKYVKIANQNKSLFELNERLKDGLKRLKEKHGELPQKPHDRSNSYDQSNVKSKCTHCGCDLYLGFSNTKSPSKISINANNSSFFFSEKKGKGKSKMIKDL